jgi:hypothetical protein
MKSSIVWDIMPCSTLKVNRRFGGKCRLHLQGRKISGERNQQQMGASEKNQIQPQETYRKPCTV